MADAIEVAVAVLRRGDGRVLVAERAAWRHQGGRLEFPGGKIDPGESLGAALARELDEELGVRPLDWAPWMRVRHGYPDRDVVLQVCAVSDWAGEPHGVEGQPVAWYRPEELSPARFPAANRPILAALRLPALCLITPTPEEAAVESAIHGLRQAVASGVRLIQLRAPGLSSDAWRRFIEGACEVVAATAAPVYLLANTDDPAWLERCPALGGIHLSARAARGLRQRPLPENRLLSCACHDLEEIRQAERLDADLIVIGSVRSTPSHAGRAPLGWPGLAELTAATTVPAYAVGGMRPADAVTARQHGAIGIAAIRGLWPQA